MEHSSDLKSRRKFLAGAGVALGTALAGCGTDNSDSEEGPNGTDTDRFHTPNKTVQSTQTPKPVANQTNTTETSTDETPTPNQTKTETRAPEKTTTETWRDLTGEQVYTNNIAPSGMRIGINQGNTTLGEYTQQVKEENQIFVDDPLKTLQNIGRHGVTQIPSNDYTTDGHMNHDAYQFVEHILHTEHDVDEARVFQDVSRPRESGFLDMTIVLDDELYRFAANGTITETQIEKAIQPLHQTDIWDTNNHNSGNALDYQEVRNWIEDEGGTFDDVEKGIEGAIDLETSLSYDNSTGWLAPTQDLHAMAGAVHHYAAGQDEVEVERFDGISIDDFDVEDVVEFRDEVNNLKQEYGHNLGDGERVYIDAAYEDGDFELEAETISDWEIENAFYVEEK